MTFRDSRTGWIESRRVTAIAHGVDLKVAAIQQEDLIATIRQPIADWAIQADQVAPKAWVGFCEACCLCRDHQVRLGFERKGRECILAEIVFHLPTGQVYRRRGWVEYLDPFAISLAGTANWIVHHLTDYHMLSRLGAAERWEERGEQGEQAKQG